jgi:competence ComEA-like helix-hairpin-helix protein
MGNERRVAILFVVVLAAAISLAVIAINRVKYKSIDSPAVEQTAATLFEFDPNTVSYDELLSLGFEKQTAISLLKFRSRGKVFTIAEEVALCYGVSDSMFRALRPYIVIGEQFRPQPKRYDSNTADSLQARRREQWQQKIDSHTPHPVERFRIDTVGVEYLCSIGFTYRQAEGLIKYRSEGAQGIRNMRELRDCWAVSPEMADSLAHYVIFPEPKPYGGKIEINSADSATLVTVRGIGAKTAAAIVHYRELLGGYVSVEQLRELKCVTSENFARFSQQICCDSCVFSKIDINFAPASELELHPYMTRSAINRIIKLRKSKGGWKSIEEIVSDNIFTQEQVVSLAPYLHFGTTPLDFDYSSNQTDAHRASTESTENLGTQNVQQ